MKKILSLILVFVMVFAFTGCKSEEPDIFAGTYNAVSEEQLSEIKDNFEGWFDEKWDTYSGSVTISSDMMGMKINQAGTLYAYTVPGEELLKLETSASVYGTKIKAELYTKDGTHYVKSSSGGTIQAAYSMPADLDEYYTQLEQRYNDMGMEIDFSEFSENSVNNVYNLRKVLETIDFENVNLDKITATSTSGAMKIKVFFPDFEFKINAGSISFDYEIKQDLELYFNLDKDNNLTDVRIVFKSSEDMSGISISSVYEITIKPYSGQISLPDDLNETNYPSYFDYLYSL